MDTEETYLPGILFKENGIKPLSTGRRQRNGKVKNPCGRR